MGVLASITSAILKGVAFTFVPLEVMSIVSRGGWVDLVTVLSSLTKFDLSYHI